MRSIPVIDLFAGPGGLSEGFSRYGEQDWSSVLSEPLVERGGQVAPKSKASIRFKIALSIEMDTFAHRTLRLRSLVRLLRESGKSADYYARLSSGEVALEDLYRLHPKAFEVADAHCWRAELGKIPAHEVDQRITKALNGAEEWVLIGGPPCQAYSLVGRSRNQGKQDYRPEADHRHYLYREYLRIVATHRPALFVMENVKGLLSSQVDGGRIFTKILDDLRNPAADLEYRLEPIAVDQHSSEQSEIFAKQTTGHAFLVRTEEHGVPQARHRVILVGVRKGHTGKVRQLVRRMEVPISKVLRAPPVHAGVKGDADWKDTLLAAKREPWFSELAADVRARITMSLHDLALPQKRRGAEFIEGSWRPEYASDWYCSPELHGFLNHSTRSHIVGDLHRYLFAASWAKLRKVSPTLRDFPERLLPSHANAKESAQGHGPFGDRFRVQLSGRPSTTITSHISKDGHYYIHPAPEQCRSLTVREAARLQTFADDYFFCGPRTEQYHQVGNAVPSLLAVQIAEAVASAF